jgi:two-component system cell cycle response regulator
MAAHHPTGTTGRLLLVDDSAIVLEAVGSRLRAQGLDVVATPSPREALALATADSAAFDLFVLDVMMPEMDGHELTRRLRAHPRSTHTPILLLTSRDSTAERVAGLAAGADDFFTKTVPDVEMIARVRSFISLGKMRAHLQAQSEAMARVVREPEQASAPARVEVLHQRPPLAAELAEALRRAAAAVPEGAGPEAVRYEVSAGAPGPLPLEGRADVLVVSYELALAGEHPLLTRYGFDEDAPAVLVVDEAESSERRVAAFDAGAYDYLTPGTPLPELAARLASTVRRHRTQKQLRSSRDRAALAAVVDPLTRLHNRAYFQESLLGELKRAQRYGRPVTLLILDLDHFKKVNDTLGHLAGDEALREVAQRLRRTARSTDILARYGGEEFAVILPETGLELGRIAAERFRAAIEGAEVHGANGKSRPLTVSVGMASAPEHATGLEALFHAADTALYRAKRAGRNQVCCAGGPDGSALPPGATPPPAAGALAPLERLRRLLSDDPEAPLNSLATAARMLREGSDEGDPLHAITTQLHGATEQVRGELKRALDELSRLLPRA